MTDWQKELWAMLFGSMPKEALWIPRPHGNEGGSSQECHYFPLRHCFWITLRIAATGLISGLLVLTQPQLTRKTQGRQVSRTGIYEGMVACRWWWVEYLRRQNSILSLCFLTEARSMVTSARRPFVHILFRFFPLFSPVGSHRIRVKLPFNCLNIKDAAYQLI